MASGQQTFARSTEKTLSYKQLKTNYYNILKEHGECQVRLGKQQSSLHNAKSARKRLEKENHELKDQLSQKDTSHREILAEVTQKMGMTNAKLENKVGAYEGELERLGIDPVSLQAISDDDNEEKENRRKEIKTKVDSLLAHLTDNVERSEAVYDQLQNILHQCNTINGEVPDPPDT